MNLYEDSKIYGMRENVRNFDYDVYYSGHFWEVDKD
jgi:hypothetical protein